MKNIVKTGLALLMCICLGFNLQAQHSKEYEQSLGEALVQLQQAENYTEMQKHNNTIERIAKMAPEDWITNYYAAYGLVLSSYKLDKDDIDDQLDKAQKYIDECLEIDKSIADVHVLQAWLHSARISVSPMMRGMSYSSKSNTSLEIAEKLDPKNPRIYYMRGQNIFYKPAMFGGGAKAAISEYEKAAKLFASFKKPTALWPSWGEKINAQMLKTCQQKING